jgi:hypothetical protein
MAVYIPRTMPPLSLNHQFLQNSLCTDMSNLISLLVRLRADPAISESYKSEINSIFDDVQRLCPHLDNLAQLLSQLQPLQPAVTTAPTDLDLMHLDFIDAFEDQWNDLYSITAPGSPTGQGFGSSSALVDPQLDNGVPLPHTTNVYDQQSRSRPRRDTHPFSSGSHVSSSSALDVRSNRPRHPASQARSSSNHFDSERGTTSSHATSAPYGCPPPAPSPPQNLPGLRTMNVVKDSERLLDSDSEPEKMQLRSNKKRKV